MITVVFWLSVVLVVYPYVVYPLVMAYLGRRRPRGPVGTTRPRVSVIIAAHNEAEWIERKIASTLGQDYPADRLEVIVVSDGSTDATESIVHAIGDSRVRLIARDERQGKSTALNLAVAEARGDLLVFTDANALFAPGAIARLAAPFADPSVGLVSGQGLYGELADGQARAVANGYARLESLLKRGETALGFIGCADGAIYALRRSLYRDLAPAEVSDLTHTIETTLAGYRSCFDPDALTVEPPSKNAGQEFRRHVRIIAQGFDAVVTALPRLLAARRWAAVWVLVSHRVLRWTCAVALGGVLGTSLVGQGWPFVAALACQAFFYGIAAIAALSERMGRGLGVLAAPYYFCTVTIAGTFGFLRFLRAGGEAVWSPGGAVRS